MKNAILIILFLILALGCTDLIIAKIHTNKLVRDALISEDCTLKTENIDPGRIHALLRVEDPNFYGHKGLDFRSPGAGWTTISQGLVKKLYFRSFKPRLAKIRLILIARFIFHPSVEKEDQLRLFFNYAYMGNDSNGNEIRGFAKASWFYFQKDFQELGMDEYLSLVALLLNTARFRPDKYPEANAERIGRIKKYLEGDCVPSDWKDCELSGCK